MKCSTCKYEWKYSPDWTSPYGEWSCIKTENDLYGTEPEDVEDCEYYDKSEE